MGLFEKVDEWLVENLGAWYRFMVPLAVSVVTAFLGNLIIAALVGVALLAFFAGIRFREVSDTPKREAATKLQGDYDASLKLTEAYKLALEEREERMIRIHQSVQALCASERFLAVLNQLSSVKFRPMRSAYGLYNRPGLDPNLEMQKKILSLVGDIEPFLSPERADRLLSHDMIGPHNVHPFHVRIEHIKTVGPEIAEEIWQESLAELMAEMEKRPEPIPMVLGV